MGQLDGKTAVITGGSQGIGLATAQRFHAEGARVFITGRNQQSLEQAARSIGSNVTPVRADTSDLDDIERLFRTVADATDGLDVVVANAAARLTAPLAGITEQDFADIYDTNVRGVVFTVQKALPLLRSGASIVLIGSGAAHQGRAGTSLYASSKAALPSLARVWTSEFKDRRIRTSVITPGGIDSGSFERHLSPGDAAAAKEAIAQATPLGRMGRPDEIASAALFLASDESSYITGTELVVDGGITSV